MNTIKSGKRYELIDGIRGFTILSMIGYHFSYDAFILYDRYPEWLSNPFGYAWQQSICITFILICGFSASFSRSNLKRGLLLNGCGLLVTVATRVFSPEAVVYFGVLNLLGCSLLLLIPIKKLVNRKNWKTAAVICLLLFLFTRHIQRGYLGFGSLQLIELPRALYELKWLTPFGFPYPGFYSSDYFPILPWFFLFMVGYAFHYVLGESGRVRRVLSKRIPGLTKLGRYSLIIYLLHQPALMVLCVLLF